MRNNFSTFFNGVDDLLFVLDMEGRIIKANATACRRLKYSENELIGRSVLQVHPPHRREEAGQILAEMLAGKRRECPVPVMDSDGALIDVETYITRGKWNGQDALFGVTKDMSAIKRSEEKFAKAFANMNSTVMAISTIQEGVYVDVNEAFCADLGYKKEEVIGKTSVELFLFEDVTQRNHMINELEKSGYLRNVEFKILARDGGVREGLLSAERIDLNGRPHLLTMFFDITERRWAEENLRRREQEYKTLVEHTPDVIARFDRQYRHIYVNPIVEKEFGTPPVSLLGRSHRELGQSPEMAEWSEKVIHQVFETGQEVAFELTNPTPMGNKYYLSRGVPEFAEDGSVMSVLFIHHNITNRKQAEDQLHAAEAKYRDIFENAIEGIFQSTPDGRFLNINAAMARIFGYETPEEMITSIGNNIGTRIYASPSQRFEFIRVMEQVGVVKDFEAENRRKDGSVIWTRTSARGIKDADGVVLYYEGFLEDITERKRTDEKLQEANKRLEEQLEEIKILQDYFARTGNP